uniref:uncharacterized protein LOC118548215 n=1 Tax=Halichoerus grypus TaxID=9711 RepID=UPI0016596538|nr:uncharacterized protein LOC118548215 [Halichoerus grypus]
MGEDRGRGQRKSASFRAGVYHPGVLTKAEVNSPRSPSKSASTPGRETEVGGCVQWRPGTLRSRLPVRIPAPAAWLLASGPGSGVSSRRWLLWPPGRRGEHQHPRTETRGAAEPLGQINSSETCPREARTRRRHTEPARLRAAPERAGQQWALAILLCPARSPLGPGLLRPLLLLLLLLLLLPSAGLIAEPPACKVPGARAATSRRHCRVSVGARIPCLARLLRGAPKLAPRAAGAPRRCPWLSPRADFGRPTGSTAALLSGDGVHRIIPNTLCKKVFLPCEATGVVASPPTQCLILHKYCLEQVPVGLELQRRDPHEASIEATEGNFVL